LSKRFSKEGLGRGLGLLTGVLVGVVVGLGLTVVVGSGVLPVPDRGTPLAEVGWKELLDIAVAAQHTFVDVSNAQVGAVLFRERRPPYNLGGE
jgi:hypothetical protein